MLVVFNSAGDTPLAVENCPIWRYMDYAKFAASIRRQNGFGLWFSPIGDLADADPYEGTLSSDTSRNMAFKIASFLVPFVRGSSSGDPTARTINGKIVDTTSDDSLAELISGMIPAILADMSQNASRKAVNCWHMNETESKAMWSLYCQSEYGVVIESNVDKLCNTIRSADPQSECVTAGSVMYRDQRTIRDREEDVNSFFFRKQPQFRHENEFRLVKGIIKSSDGTSTWDKGFFVDVDLSQLAITIRVHPESPPWFIDHVKEDVASAALPVEVQSSALLVKPLPVEELVSTTACVEYALQAIRRLSDAAATPPEETSGAQ
jgi:hypothetical protein